MAVTPPDSAERYRRHLRGRVVDACQALVSGKRGVVAVARELTVLAHELHADADEDFLYFIGLDSETDHFPLGMAREHWSQTALAREDLARAEYEKTVAADAVRRAEILLARYAESVV
jgi:hypothetical protein